MSRVGKKRIILPAKVKVSQAAGGAVTVEGPKGSLSWTLPKEIELTQEGEEVSLVCKKASRRSSAFHGLSRALIANMVTGVSEGFRKSLEIQGVGFKAAVQGNILNLSLGKSHPIHFPIPEMIKVAVTDNTKVSVEGIDKQQVGQVAADIRAFYPPEPYKGKGVRYTDEVVRRKEGKTVQ